MVRNIKIFIIIVFGCSSLIGSLAIEILANAKGIIQSTPILAQSNWYSPDWLYRQEIIIDHTKVGENLTDFPLLITQDNIKPGLFSHAQNDGDDILFTSSNGLTKLAHEIEKYDPAPPEKLWIWVKVDLSSTDDTSIFVYYGNASADNQQNPTAVWDTDFLGVYHLEELSGTIYDATAHHNCNPGGSPVYDVVGRINGAISLDYSTSDLINCGTDWLGTGALTISGWINPANLGGGGYGRITDNGTLVLRFPTDTRLSFSSDAMTHEALSAAGSIVMGSWQRFDVIRNASGITNIYINGSLSGTADQNSGTPGAATTDIVLGNKQDGSRGFGGYMDETQISSIMRSVGWVTTEYNNQSSPSTFYSVNDEEEYEAPSIPSLLPESGNSNNPIKMILLFFYHLIASDL